MVGWKTKFQNIFRSISDRFHNDVTSISNQFHSIIIMTINVRTENVRPDRFELRKICVSGAREVAGS